MLNVQDTPESAPPMYESVSSHTPTDNTSLDTSPSNLDTSPSNLDTFPSDIPGSVWTWAHYGTKPNGIIEFLPNGSTKWVNGARQGHWKLKNGETVLEAEFNGVLHELEYVASEKKAVLRTPQRARPSQMWIQGDRG